VGTPRFELTVAVSVVDDPWATGLGNAETVVVLVNVAMVSESVPVEVAKMVSPE
jgi:hypothetical protein